MFTLSRQPATSLLLIALCGCWGLPNDFNALSLQEKVQAYKKHLSRYGRPRRSARSQISWHGWEAATLMADYLRGTEKGLPEREALEIIHLVQLRGCSLKGTVAEREVESFVRRVSSGSMYRTSAENVLGSIRQEVTMRDGPDTLTGGPCDEARSRR